MRKRNTTRVGRGQVSLDCAFRSNRAGGLVYAYHVMRNLGVRVSFSFQLNPYHRV